MLILYFNRKRAGGEPKKERKHYLERSGMSITLSTIFVRTSIGFFFGMGSNMLQQIAAIAKTFRTGWRVEECKENSR